MADADVVVIGGGPSGAVSALELARRGVAVTVLEAERFPRFHVGESFLPRTLELLRELGLEDRLMRLPRIRKLGAEFLMGHGDDAASEVWFADALGGGDPETFNTARAAFDQMLLEAARDAGAEVRAGVRVRSIDRLADGDVRLETNAGPVAARWLVDASGQAAVVGRHLGTRRVLARHRKVAHFAHMTGVWRNPGDREGFPTVVMTDEGWFWIIPVDESRTSVGLVIDQAAARAAGEPPRRMLAWAIGRCPVMAARCADAEPTGQGGGMADFSYRCRPYAGPGHVLVGDAALFVDPVFSTGVCLGMVSAVHVAEMLAGVLRDGDDPEEARRRYVAFVDGSTRIFFRLIDHFYRPAFRDLFLEAKGPLGLHSAAIEVLSGRVFPRPSWAVRWRLRLLDAAVAVQQRTAIVPRRRGFSLLDGRCC